MKAGCSLIPLSLVRCDADFWEILRCMGINSGLPIKFKEWTKSFDELVQNRKVKECAYHGFWVITAGSLIHNTFHSSAFLIYFDLKFWYACHLYCSIHLFLSLKKLNVCNQVEKKSHEKTRHVLKKIQGVVAKLSVSEALHLILLQCRNIAFTYSLLFVAND